MKLTELRIGGLKCFRDEVIIPIKDLSVLIGENDSGKSTLLRAIDLLLGKTVPLETEYFSLRDEGLDEITITGKFTISNSDNRDELSPFLVNSELLLKKRYRKGEGFRVFVRKVVLDDDDFENYKSLRAEPLKQLLARLGLPARPIQDERKALVGEFIGDNYANLNKTIQETEITIPNFQSLSQFLPIYQYYGSHEYGDPQALIRKTLNNIYSSHFYDETGKLRIQTLVGLRERLLEKLNRNIEEKLLEKFSNIVLISEILGVEWT